MGKAIKQRPAGAVDLETSWTYKISVLAYQVARQTSAAAQAASQLNLSQWRVIAAVADRPGITARDVVRMTPMDKAIVSRAVRVLVDAGYLLREASPIDGRVSHLYLTASGVDVFCAIAAAHDRAHDAATKALSPDDHALLLKLLDPLIAAYAD